MIQLMPVSGELTEAIANRDVKYAIDLLENGADPNERGFGVLLQGETALHLSIAYGSPELAKLLIEKGAELEAININDQTPLMYAARYNDASTLALLVEKGVSIDTKDCGGLTARQWADSMSHHNLAELITNTVTEKAAREAREKEVAEFHDTAAARQEAINKRRRPFGPRPA